VTKTTPSERTKLRLAVVLQLGVVALTLYACSSAYSEGDSPPGNDGGGGGDSVAQSKDGLGKRCATAADCPSGLCTPAGTDPNTGEVLSVCTIACGPGNDCFPGWSCGPLAGTTTSACLCNARIETCNGKDDNCNGVIDEPEEAIKQCGANGGKEWSCTNGSCSCIGKACSVAFDGGTTNACVDPLTNGSHCGECNAVCGFASECVQGGCVCNPTQCATNEANASAKCIDGSCRVERLVASDATSGFALDGAQIFLFSPDAAEIQKVSKLGGVPVRVGAASAVSRILVDGLTLIYGQTNGVFYCDKDLCAVPTGIGAVVNGLTLHQGRIYWMNGSTLASSLPDGGSGAFFNLSGATAGGVSRIFVESSGRAYVAIANDSSLLRVSLQDGGAEALSGALATNGLAADTDRLYFVGQSVDAGADIRGCTRPNCMSNTIIAGGAGARGGPLLVERGRIYWADSIGLRSCAVTGCSGVPKIVVEGSITDVATDGTSLFFTRRSPGGVESLYSTPVPL
jgi:hypothetical protein